jgi:hypothetical protein
VLEEDWSPPLCRNKLFANIRYPTTARTGQPEQACKDSKNIQPAQDSQEQDCQDRTARKAKQRKHCHDGTARKVKSGLHSQDKRTLKTGQSRRESQDCTVRTELPGMDCRDRTVGAGKARIGQSQSVQGSRNRNRTARKGHPEQGS